MSPHGAGHLSFRILRDLHASGSNSWMDGGELNEAIPPAYTQWVGAALVAHLAANEAAA